MDHGFRNDLENPEFINTFTKPHTLSPYPGCISYHSLTLSQQMYIRSISIIFCNMCFDLETGIFPIQTLQTTYVPLILLLWRYNSDRILVFSKISSHLRRSCTCSAHFISFIFFRTILTSSFHRYLGLPAGLSVNGFHLCILLTMLVSGILFMCPNQLNRSVLT